MQRPNVSSRVKDPKRNITFEVLAYRGLSQSELLQAVHFFRATKQGRKLKNNTVYTIETLIGLRD